MHNLRRQEAEVRISWGDRKNAIHKTERTRESPPDDTYEGNALYKHDQMEHDGEKADCCFEPIKLFRDPLTRQINEGVKINQSLADEQCTLLNSLAKFMQGAVSRVEIVRGLNK